MPKVQVVVRLVKGDMVIERTREWEVEDVPKLGAHTVAHEATQAAYEVMEDWFTHANAAEAERQRVDEDDDGVVVRL